MSSKQSQDAGIEVPSALLGQLQAMSERIDEGKYAMPPTGPVPPPRPVPSPTPAPAMNRMDVRTQD